MNIRDFLNQEDKSGKLSKEKWLIKNNIEAYNLVINHSINNNISFKEKVYLYIHDLNDVPICKNENCNKLPKFINKTLGYSNYCSNRCQSTSKEIIEKRKNTNIERFGVEYTIFNKEVNNKFYESVNNRSKEDKKLSNIKRKKTNIENFGYDNPNKNPIFIKKRIESFISSKENHKSYTINISLFQKYEKNIKIDQHIKINNTTYLNCTCLVCNQKFTINYPLLHYRHKNNHILCTICNNPSNNHISHFHKEVIEKFINIFNIENIIINDRSILNGKELDIYVPELNLAVECNGIYWHSISKKDTNYHLEKFNLCKDKNINLFFIWECENIEYELNYIKDNYYKEIIFNEEFKIIDGIKINYSKTF